jgi:hypothetical protein
MNFGKRSVGESEIRSTQRANNAVLNFVAGDVKYHKAHPAKAIMYAGDSPL